MDALKMDALRDRPKVLMPATASRGGAPAPDKPMMALSDAMAHLQKARRECIEVALDIAGGAVTASVTSSGAQLPPPACLLDEVRATAMEIHAVADAVEATAAALRAQL